MTRGNSISALIVCLLMAAAPLCAQHRAPAAPRGPAPLYVPRSAVQTPVQRNQTSPHNQTIQRPSSAAPQAPANGIRPGASGTPGGAPSAAPGQSSAQSRQTIRGQGPHNGDWLRDNRRLTPEEQQRRLQQDPNFNRLPPQRQQQLLNRLNKFNAMPPQQQQRVLNRMQMMERLPPAQQQRANQLFGQFKQMPPERKQAVRQALHQMHNMPPDARERLLNSPEIRGRFSPDEVRMLHGFNDIGFIE